MSATAFSKAAPTSPLPTPGIVLAKNVTCLWRPSRSIFDGPAARDRSTTSSRGTVPSFAGGNRQPRQRLGAGAEWLAGAHEDVVFAALLLVARHLDAADQELRRQPDVQDVDAEIGRLPPVDDRHHLRVAGDQ